MGATGPGGQPHRRRARCDPISESILSTQLYLPDGTWFETVTTLIALAEQVIVWATELSPGLAQELAALQERERTADTVVLLEERDQDPLLARPEAIHDLGPLIAEHPTLAGFPNTISFKRLSGKQFHEYPELMRLVDRLHAAGAEPIKQRMARLRARLDAELAK